MSRPPQACGPAHPAPRSRTFFVLPSTGRRVLLCALAACLLLGLGLAPLPVRAEPRDQDQPTEGLRPDGIHVLDGSYVLNVGELQVNITNHGLIGSQYSAEVPYNHAPSAQWPSGSGNEYLWGAGLWVGARIGGEVSVTTGQYQRELRPGNDLMDTIYEARDKQVVRPSPDPYVTGRRFPLDGDGDDDQDGRTDEDPLNGRDDDGDGLVDEDWGQLGDQMFTCTMRDDTPLAQEVYPDHRPLGIRVIQRAAAWADNELDDIVALDFEVTNVGIHTLEDVYLGMFVDCDIRSREEGYDAPDDLAGFFRGAVRGDDGLFYRANIGYMMDGARENPLPGCLGFMLIDHTIDFLGRDAPFHYDVGSFQIFSTNAAYNQEGEPANDLDRYHAMSLNGRYDPNTRPEDAADMKYLMSSGPFGHFSPGTTVNYRVAMVAGNGVQGMLETAAVAAQLGAGSYPYYGSSGNGPYDTQICLGDIRPLDAHGPDPLLGRRAMMMNESCAGSDPIMFVTVLTESDFTATDDGRMCTWVNMDNCEECFRVLGHDCTPSEYRNNSMQRGYSGYYNRPWVWARLQPPPRPRLRVTAGDHQVELFWDDVSEHAVDPNTGVLDFESYRLWRVSDWVPPARSDEGGDPPAVSWGMFQEYDLINQMVNPLDPFFPDVPTMPLGSNTGLEPARYTPACLGDARFEGLAAAMQALVDSDTLGVWLERPPVRRASGVVAPGMEALAPWETYPDVLDTFFAVARRTSGVPKRGVQYYHHLDTEVHNGFRYYYSISAMDHTLVLVDDEYVPTGPGLENDPGNDFLLVVPRPEAQTAEHLRRNGRNIYVYPNPATRESLAQNQPYPPDLDDPTGVRVVWNNLPLAHNTIRIFTAAGDLVDTVHHDGYEQGGSASWNLVSRNGQEVTSGIYLYVVESDQAAFEDFQGRFVVVR